MIYTKITHCNLQNALGYLHKGKLNNKTPQEHKKLINNWDYVIFGFTGLDVFHMLGASHQEFVIFHTLALTCVMRLKDCK